MTLFDELKTACYTSLIFHAVMDWNVLIRQSVTAATKGVKHARAIKGQDTEEEK